MLRRGFTALIICFVCMAIVPLTSFAQKKILKGIVKDRQSDEPIPYASVVFKTTSQGTLTDSSGAFAFEYNGSSADTLLVTSVGYTPVAMIVPPYKDSTSITIKMDVAAVSKEAVVKVKFNRALWFWNRIEKYKHLHDRSNYKNYSYEIYNKLELDLANINAQKLAKNKILKPFNFILNNVDTSEGKPYLPVFLTETLSDYYFQHDPKKVKEIIKASKTDGVDNESVTKLLGGTYQNVNVYKNFIPVFDKYFVSPFNDNGDNFYNYKLLDTQYVRGKKLVHLGFNPKHKGQNTFVGDCWVADTSYAIQKITLRPSEDANINYVKGLTLIQEFKQINDSTWFLSKDKFVVDITLLGKSKGSFKGRKTSSYENVLYDSDSIANVLTTNQKAEEVIVLKNSEAKPEAYWDSSRHEPLSKDESSVYKMIDTIQTLPAFKKYYNAAYFLTTGLKYFGNYEIGPWYNWISSNSWEGLRLRFDLGTNYKFSKKWYLHEYLAYGFQDKVMKGLGEVFYLPKKNPRMYLYASYQSDLDNGQQYYDEVSTDNIFSLAFRKPGIPFKTQAVREKRFEFLKEFHSGFSFLLAVTSRQYEPLRGLPAKSYYVNTASGQPLNNFETSVRLRYAYLEKFLETTFLRSSLGSNYPIVEVRYSKGWAGVLKSSYNYHKIDFDVDDYLKVPPGLIYYDLFAGQTFGTLPYSLLTIHPGNEIYYYNKYAFNLMNRFEYISDKYAGYNIEYNIGNGLFRYLPITRKLKFRQLFSVKGLVGSLSDANQKLNFVGTQSFKTLNGKMYMEVGTGVDNILKVLRFDFVWRILPQPLPAEKVNRFGIFGSFRVTF